MNKLYDEAFELVVGGRTFNQLRRDYGHSLVGRKHTFDAPKDFTPGRHEDHSKGYHRGSLIINERKEVFMCVDETEGKANWIIMGSLEDMATKTSFIRNQGSEDEPTPPTSTANGSSKPSEEPYEEVSGQIESEHIASSDVSEHMNKPAPKEDYQQSDKKQFDENVKKSDSGKGYQIGTESGPERGKTAIPEDMPWAKYCRKNGLEYIEDVAKAIADGSLAEMSYLNADRVESIKGWLAEN